VAAAQSLAPLLSPHDATCLLFLSRHVYLQANSKAAPISHKPTPQVTHATKPPFLFMALFYPAREEFSILSVNYPYTDVLYYNHQLMLHYVKGIRRSPRTVATAGKTVRCRA
jgi:hypothetical protein